MGQRKHVGIQRTPQKRANSGLSQLQLWALLWSTIDTDEIASSVRHAVSEPMATSFGRAHELSYCEETFSSTYQVGDEDGWQAQLAGVRRIMRQGATPKQRRQSWQRRVDMVASGTDPNAPETVETDLDRIAAKLADGKDPNKVWAPMCARAYVSSKRRRGNRRESEARSNELDWRNADSIRLDDYTACSARELLDDLADGQDLSAWETESLSAAMSEHFDSDDSRWEVPGEPLDPYWAAPCAIIEAQALTEDLARHDGMDGQQTQPDDGRWMWEDNCEIAAQASKYRSKCAAVWHLGCSTMATGTAIASGGAFRRNRSPNADESAHMRSGRLVRGKRARELWAMLRHGWALVQAKHLDGVAFVAWLRGDGWRALNDHILASFRQRGQVHKVLACGPGYYMDRVDTDKLRAVRERLLRACKHVRVAPSDATMLSVKWQAMHVAAPTNGRGHGARSEDWTCDGRVWFDLTIGDTETECNREVSIIVGDEPTQGVEFAITTRRPLPSGRWVNIPRANRTALAEQLIKVDYTRPRAKTA